MKVCLVGAPTAHEFDDRTMGEAEALRTWALHLAARRAKPVAVVALARRLAGILYALLRDGTVFTPRRSPLPVDPATLSV